MDDRHVALARCLEKLPTRDRDLVLTRYEPGSGVPEAARRSGRSLEAAYKALGAHSQTSPRLRHHINLPPVACHEPFRQRNPRTE